MNSAVTDEMVKGMDDMAGLSPRILSPKAIQAARQWFADNALACIAEVESGAVRVNDRAAYFARRHQDHADYLAGKRDHTFTLRQRAHFIQYGEMVALLP